MLLLGMLATAVVFALTLMTSTSASQPMPVAAGYSGREGMNIEDWRSRDSVP
jgi:hypothetical protein